MTAPTTIRSPRGRGRVTHDARRVRPRDVGRTTVVVAVEPQHRLFGECICGVLTRAGNAVVGPRVGNGDDLEHGLAAVPDALVVDLAVFERQLVRSGVTRARRHGCRVILVRVEADASLRCPLGADVVIDGHHGVRELLAAVAAAVSPSGADVAFSRGSADSRFDELSPREGAVLGALMRGRTAKEIAADDYIAISTVRSQIRAVLTKLGVSSQLEAVAAAHRVGWSPTSSRFPQF